METKPVAVHLRYPPGPVNGCAACRTDATRSAPWMDSIGCSARRARAEQRRNRLDFEEVMREIGRGEVMRSKGLSNQASIQ